MAFHRKDKKAFVFFLLGTLLGSVFIVLFFGKKLDSLYLEREILYYKQNQKDREIAQMRHLLSQQEKNNAWRQKNATTIRKIRVEVESNIQFGQEYIKEKVETMLEPFINKSVQWIINDPSLIDNMLRERTIALPDKNKTIYEIKLKYMIFMDSQLKLWVTAQEKTEKNVRL